MANIRLDRTGRQACRGSRKQEVGKAGQDMGRVVCNCQQSIEVRYVQKGDLTRIACGGASSLLVGGTYPYVALHQNQE